MPWVRVGPNARAITVQRMKIIASLAAGALLAWSAASHAQPSSCEGIRDQIDAKVRASGVTGFTLTVVDAQAQVGGRVVGSCELGTKKIVYDRGAAAPQPRAKPKSQPIITECKDGSVSVGGECKP